MPISSFEGTSYKLTSTFTSDHTQNIYDYLELYSTFYLKKIFVASFHFITDHCWN